MITNEYNVNLDSTRNSKNPQKIQEKYQCEFCNYATNLKSNFSKHIASKKHKLQSTPNKKYNCVSCKYFTNNQKDYDNHLLTKKHNLHMNINIDQMVMDNTANKIVMDKNIFIEIIKNNTEFKELVTEQNKTIMEQNIKLNKMLENGVTSITNTNCNNNNKTFNLQFFLNEQCKDALNMIDFINSLQFNPGSVEYTGKHGYVEGMMKLIMDGLKELDVYKRPIHCTDLKRDILYIKEENKWEKDTEENNIFNNALHKIVQKNIQQIRKWREENPRCEIMETKEYEFHFVLMQQCIGGGTGQQEPNNKKILKNIAKYVLVDRNIV